MAETIFYTAVEESVTTPLNLRKIYYESADRNSAMHAWLFQKMAYASAEAYNEVTGKLKFLSTPIRGGLGKIKSDGNSSGGLYKNVFKPKDSYPKGGRFTPKPHINSVKISNEGDFGSLKKSEVAFTVYTLTDLNDCQPFFDLGANLQIKYGWNDAGGAGGKTGTFDGVIYNFTYSVNSEGAFDCVSYGMSAGINTLTGDTKASSDSGGKKATDAAGNEVQATTIIGEIDILVLNAASLAENAIDSNGIGAIRFPTSWGSDETPPPAAPVSGSAAVSGASAATTTPATGTTATTPAATANTTATPTSTIPWLPSTTTPTTPPAPISPYMPAPPSEFPTVTPWSSLLGSLVLDQPHYYISLEKIVELVNNKVLRAAGGPRFSRLIIKCNGTVTKCNVPPADKLVSGNPLQVLFPGFGNYGTHTFFTTDYVTEMKNGDLSKAMISVDWLKETLKAMGTLTADAQKSANKSVGKFLQNILDLIHINSGTRFKLSLVSNPKDDREILIADANYVETRVVPYEITAVTKNSICRSISLTSSVPSDVAAAAFIANTNTLAPLGVGIGSINKIPDATTTVSGSAQEQFEIAKKNIDAANLGPNTDNVIAMQAAIKRLYVGGSNSGGTNREKESVPFPISFSCTLDGIEGIVFGNTITSNYLPTAYQTDKKTPKVAFTVTKVEHNIAGNDWTTTISTVCRTLPTF